LPSQKFFGHAVFFEVKVKRQRQIQIEPRWLTRLIEKMDGTRPRIKVIAALHTQQEAKPIHFLSFQNCQEKLK
jgi:hypothetical protein